MLLIVCHYGSPELKWIYQLPELLTRKKESFYETLGICCFNYLLNDPRCLSRARLFNSVSNFSYYHGDLVKRLRPRVLYTYI